MQKQTFGAPRGVLDTMRLLRLHACPDKPVLGSRGGSWAQRLVPMDLERPLQGRLEVFTLEATTNHRLSY